MSEITFIIPGAPKGKERPRVTRYGTYTPKSTKDFEAHIRACWQQQTHGARLPDGEPLYAEICAYFAVPASFSKKQRAELLFQPTPKKPDCDNIAKAVLDSLNGYAYKDDSAISVLRVTKIYTDGAPYIGVLITNEMPTSLE